VMISVFLLTHRLYEALVLAAVSSATAPAATVMVLEETRSRGDLTTTILSVVALDDGIALILYAFASSIAKVLLVHKGRLVIQTILGNSALEILGALLLGSSIGLVLSLVARQTRSRTDVFALTIGAILVSIGAGKTSLIKSLIFHFWLKELFKDTPARGAKIYIKKILSRIKCKKCEYEGSMSLRDDPFYHVYFPLKVLTSFPAVRCRRHREDESRDIFAGQQKEDFSGKGRWCFDER